MDISLTVKRYDPAKSDTSYKEEHRLSLDNKAHITILDALHMIKEGADGSLSYRCSCRSGICGSCAVRVNGYETLACTTDLVEMANKHGKVVIEPLKNLDVIKDLVVDLRPMWDRLQKIDPWLIPDETSEIRWDKETEALLEAASGCILCGACYSDCEAFKVDQDFLGPAVFNKGYRFVADPRDKERKERLEKLILSGLWHCSHCYLCASICSKGINPKDSISYLRTWAYRIGLRDEPGARYIDGFYKGIKISGRISEAFLSLKVKGINIIRDIPFFSKVLIRGKIPSLKMPIKGIGEIKKIYKIIEEKRKGRT